ncbi:1,2-dihydroxy-3-keto-5-methylthiopentene dioxygenase [Marinobacterium arenosum]|uniref:1,2-dihydroxy-3-keto-5-methylthiopentene dioxygenase n=1 Tax=Marinobacterium arenosum TaxID=2862496 RepID=UPI001C95A203|nr:cupin [Marinobacterium arenosum]MBY4678939.1 cupin [Marinobacterium arenosum]
MSALTIYPEDNPQQVLLNSNDGDEIARQLADVGVRFERWQADREIGPQSSPEEILAAYGAEIERLKAEQGYVTVDTISLAADNPAKDELRQKFLSEHTHGEDEVRFFVRGEGMFYLHLGDKVYQVHCCRDDLISVPANSRHWFDMGPQPNFTAIRLFNNPDGWVAHYTGDQIADQFPKFD